MGVTQTQMAPTISECQTEAIPALTASITNACRMAAILGSEQKRIRWRYFMKVKSKILGP
jgi:hypothetical protein